MRCIDADKLIMKDIGDGNYLVTRESIVNAPTFEAEPIRSGKWIWGTTCTCSICGEELPKVLVGGCTVDKPYPETEYIEETRYCPSCGAKMEEGD